MALAEQVKISRRFQRSINIDADFGDTKSLEGFICPKSSTEVLSAMAGHVAETGHGAFTWTGPYGSGKSSLAVAFGALLGSDAKLSQLAKNALGVDVSDKILSALPPKQNGWALLPVVGRRAEPASVIGEAIEKAGLHQLRSGQAWTDSLVVDVLSTLSQNAPKRSGGLILFIDEMGKFLEAASQQKADVYLFQLIAEAASRSDGRLIVIGVLHQSFEEYAGRFSRDMRDEWAKIQGRFVDLSINAAGEEQLEIISRAIETDAPPASISKYPNIVSKEISRQRPSASPTLADTLKECWPLHPIVACLLGPISRRRFGQNQRSIFGFLNSAEPNGFQDFLKNANNKGLYEPHHLWDYLRVNLEPSILASPDGHRWATAAEVIDRCIALGGTEIHLKLLKSLALIDLFRDHSGLSASKKLLTTCGLGHSQNAIISALDKLSDWSLIVFRKFTGAYVIYAGSDFDIEQSINEELEQLRELDFSKLKSLVGLQPILAKRHYHQTGTLRWFDTQITPLVEAIPTASQYKPGNGTIGQFILAVPTNGESPIDSEEICAEASNTSDIADNVVGFSENAPRLFKLAGELVALENIKQERPELSGDFVAQREIEARKSDLETQIEAQIKEVLDNVVWFIKGEAVRGNNQSFSEIASTLADVTFSKSPVIHNELLNRIKPSSSAVAAQNALLKSMVTREGRDRLGIKGYSAEGGLFDSLLANTKLYKMAEGAWTFVSPSEDDDPARLFPLWLKAIKFLDTNSDRAVDLTELYEVWKNPPFGVKEGLLSVLAVAFIQSGREKVTLYREGVFQAHFKDIDVEILAKCPSDIQLRWMDLSDVSRRLLSSMAEIVREFDQTNSLQNLMPIDVARGLIAIFDRLHPWAKRTNQLSTKSKHVRTMFKLASDPNKFLFDDIPEAFAETVESNENVVIASVAAQVREGLGELVNSYPLMLEQLKSTLLKELQVPNASPQSVLELQQRANNIKQLGGDYRLEAFVNRISVFDGTGTSMEGIAGLAANKPTRDWIDADFERAAIELSALCRSFVRNEAFAHIKGRKDKRRAMALILGSPENPNPIHREFDIGESDLNEINNLVEKIEGFLSNSPGERDNIVLAALAEVSARYIASISDQSEIQTTRKVS